jgi:hypothetical protein
MAIPPAVAAALISAAPAALQRVFKVLFQSAKGAKLAKKKYKTYL